MYVDSGIGKLYMRNAKNVYIMTQINSKKQKMYVKIFGILIIISEHELIHSKFT